MKSDRCNPFLFSERRGRVRDADRDEGNAARTEEQPVGAIGQERGAAGDRGADQQKPSEIGRPVPGEEKGCVPRAARQGAGQQSGTERGPPDPEVGVRDRGERAREERPDTFIFM